MTRFTGGKIAKITQTERDELLYHKELPGDETTSSPVNASLPLAYLTDTNKQGPMTALNSACCFASTSEADASCRSASRVWNAVFILRSNIWTRW